MNKQEIKQQLIELQKSVIGSYEKLLQEYGSQADLDEEDTIDPEDFSHQDEATEMGQIIEMQINKAKADLYSLESLPAGHQKRVSLGAYIETNKGYYMIMLSPKSFTYKGKSIKGVSIKSPFFKAMVGKKQGEQFEFQDETNTILLVE